MPRAGRTRRKRLRTRGQTRNRIRRIMVVETPARGGNGHEGTASPRDLDRILQHVKLPPTGREPGGGTTGRIQPGYPGTEAHSLVRRDLRGHGGWAVDLLQEADAPPPHHRRDQESSAAEDRGLTGVSYRGTAGALCRLSLAPPGVDAVFRASVRCLCSQCCARNSTGLDVQLPQMHTLWNSSSFPI